MKKERERGGGGNSVIPLLGEYLAKQTDGHDTTDWQIVRTNNQQTLIGIDNDEALGAQPGK